MGRAVRLLNQGNFPPTVEGLWQTHDMLTRYLEADVREVDFAMNRYQLTSDALERVEAQLREITRHGGDSYYEDEEDGDEDSGDNRDGGGDDRGEGASRWTLGGHIEEVE